MEYKYEQFSTVSSVVVAVFAAVTDRTGVSCLVGVC